MKRIRCILEFCNIRHMVSVFVGGDAWVEYTKKQLNIVDAIYEAIRFQRNVK